MSILLTGLTGNLGSALALLLNEKQKVFCLVRGGKKRVNSGSLYGIPVKRIIDADITKELCGVSKNDFSFLKKQGIKKVIHCAASIKFDKKLKEEIWLTNYIGTLNVLGLANELNIEEIHYVSTAYASTRRNPYECSKAEAECAVKESKIRYSIYSPSVIIGDSLTGNLRSFDGFYGYFIGIYRLARKINRENEAEFNLPVYVDVSFESTINLVPINWVTKIMTMLIDVVASGKTFYLIHPNPARVQWIIEEGFRCIGVKGIKFNDYRNPQPDQTDRFLKILQRAINRELNRYYPYATGEKQFSLEAARKALGKRFFNPSTITSNLLKVLLDFAIENDFRVKGL